MSKELAKFQTDYKKIEPKLKDYNKKNVGDELKRKVMAAFQNAKFDGEDYLLESCATARDNGVTGNKVQDFMKDKAFADALKVFDKAVGMMKEEQVKLEKFCKGAEAVSGELSKLLTAIEKDLKSRKDKSKTKSDIESMRDQVKADIVEMGKSAKTFSELPPGQQTYVADFQKSVTRIVSAAPEKAAAKRDATMMPQMLEARNRTHGLGKAVKLYKEIDALCDSAIDKAGTDLKAAQPDLKTAAGKLAELKKHAEQYDKALKVSKSQVDKSKDKDKIIGDVGKIAKAYEAAERKLRGTATTIKKAA